jgi:glycosyltransferase involved in cell wall biosynthesis
MDGMNATRTADRTARPNVTVVIPCYGQAQYLPTAVRGVIAQTYADWEIIVVNDGSPDATSDVLRSLAQEFPERRIRLLEQSNAGLSNARNAGIATARGQYILPLDADDSLDPRFLACTVPILEEKAEVAIVHTDVMLFGARDEVWCTNNPFDVYHLLQQNGIAYASLFRREVWDRTGGYRPNMSAGFEDWDFWVSAAALGFRAWHVPEPLMLYRKITGSGMSIRAREHGVALRAQLLLNHFQFFTEADRTAAQLVLTSTPLPQAKRPTMAHEVELSNIISTR